MIDYKKYSILLTVFFLILGGFYIYNNSEIFDYFELLNFKIIIYLLVVKFITLFLNALFNKDLMKAFEIDLNINESFYLASMTYIGNLLLPGRLGGSLRLVYLKKKYNLQSIYLLNIFVYFFVVSIFINAFFGILSLFIVADSYNLNFFIWLIIFSFSFGISFYLLFTKFKLNKTNTNINLMKKLYNIFETAKEGWIKITEYKNLNRRLIILYVINYFFFFLEIMLIFNIFSFARGLLNIVFYNSISVFSNLIGLTPGAIGIKESLLIFSLDIISLDLNQLFVVAIIERLIALLFALIPFIYLFLFNKKQNK